MTTPTRTRDRRTDGASLIEVMIALGILGFGILAAAASQITSIKFNRDSRVRTEAAYLAEQQMEAFQAMDGTAIQAIRDDAGYPDDPDNPIDPDPNDGVARSFTRSWTITPDSPEDGVYSIQVRVNWVDQLGNTRSVTLNSVKTDT